MIYDIGEEDKEKLKQVKKIDGYVGDLSKGFRLIVIISDQNKISAY